MSGRCLLATGPEFCHRPHGGPDYPGSGRLHLQSAHTPPQLSAGVRQLSPVLLDVHSRGDIKHSPGCSDMAGQLGAAPGGSAGEPEDDGLPVHARPATWEGAPVSRSAGVDGGLRYSCQPGGLFH